MEKSFFQVLCYYIFTDENNDDFFDDDGNLDENSEEVSENVLEEDTQALDLTVDQLVNVQSENIEAPGTTFYLPLQTVRPNLKFITCLQLMVSGPTGQFGLRSVLVIVAQVLRFLSLDLGTATILPLKMEDWNALEKTQKWRNVAVRTKRDLY